MEEEEFLTVKEVAEWLRLTPRTIYSWVKQGRLKVYHVGEQLRFRREDIDALLKGYDRGENLN